VEDQEIELVHLGALYSNLNNLLTSHQPWGPMSEELVVAALDIFLNPANYPLCVMCNLGRHRTGTLIGCLRKL